MMKRIDWGNYFFILPGMIVLLLLMVYPILYNVFISFQDIQILTLTQPHNFVGFSQYASIFHDDLFYESFRNSIAFTIVSIVFQFGIGFALALFFKNKFPGNKLFRSLTLIGWMLPAVITGTVFKWIMSGDYGVFNYLLQSVGLIHSPIPWLISPDWSLYGTIVANIWVGLPFNMIVLLAGLQTVPEHLYEAAKIDGASKWRQFWFVTIPMMMPTIMIVLVLGIIWTFKVFDLVVVMTGGGPGTSSMVLPLYAYQVGFSKFDMSKGAAVSNLLFLFMLLIALVYLWIIRKEEQR